MIGVVLRLARMLRWPYSGPATFRAGRASVYVEASLDNVMLPRLELGRDGGTAWLAVSLGDGSSDDVLSATVALRDNGRVRTGFRVLRQKTFVESAEAVRAIVEHAASIGALDDLEVDPDGRRFTCRVSGWQADSARGHAAPPAVPMGARRRLDPDLRMRIMRRFGFTCGTCGFRPDGDWSAYDGTYAPADGVAALHIDHVIPISRGGADDEHNFQVLCSGCNFAKAATG